MIRTPRYLLFFSLLLLVLLAGGTGWLLLTRAGAEAVLHAVSRFTPLQIAAERIDGRLAGEVTLTNVEVRWPQGEGQAQRLLFAWRPLALLVGNVAVERLLLEGGVLHLTAAGDDNPADFTFPEIAGLPLRLRAEIEQFQGERLIVRQAGEEMEIERLYGGIAWKAGILQLQRLEFIGTPGRLSGAATADFVRPGLALDLLLMPAGDGGDFDAIAVRSDLQPIAGDRQMAGPLALVVRDRGEDRWRLQGGIDWRPDRIALTDLHLTRPGAEGEVRGEGAVFAAEGWPFDLSLHLADLDLQAETGVRTALFGRLTAEGNARGWQGRFNVENRVAGWQKGDMAGTFAGTMTGITVSDLQANWLQGTVTGKLTAAWAAGWQLEAALAGRHLQPAAIVAEWPGQINFDLQGRADWRPGASPAASIDGSLHESTLRGRALTGGIAASLQGEEVRIDRLALRGDGFDLHAAGRLRERIDFRANISRLGGLVPEARGRLRLHGWGGRRQGIIVGEIAGRGENLAWGDLRIGRGTVEGRRAATGGAFTITGDFSGFAWGEYRLATAAVQAQGTLAEHRLRLTTTGADLQLQLTAEGSYVAEAWQGELLELRTAGRLTGPWKLREAASLRVGQDRLQAANLQLAGDGEEFVALAGDLTFAPWQGWLDGQWRQLNLARGNPWLTEIALRGRSSGSGRIEWLPEERLALKAELVAAGAVTRAGQQVPVRQSAARVTWNAGGLQAEVEADLGELGTVSLVADSPQPASAAWPAEGSFATRWRLPDLAPLSPWLPETTLVGASSGDVSGRWWDGGGLEMAGKAEMNGRLSREALRLDVRRAQTTFAWGAEGLKADWTLDLGAQGQFAGQVTSGEPAQPRLPESGQFRADWKGIDLAILRPWLPEDLLLVGNLSGETRGEWLPGQRLRLSGAARVVRGDLQWQNEDGTVTAGVQQAQMSWQWQEETLAGDLRLQMENFGEAEGSFRLPLPARWPLGIAAAAPVRGRLRADLREKGLLNAIFPGLIQESRGKLALDLRLGGTWEKPEFGGDLHLRDAAAYLPGAGIHLDQIELAAKLAGQEVRIQTLQVRSGPGRITAEGELRLQQWRLASYQLRLRGEDFRAIHLPELQLQIAPDLQLSGTTEKMVVRGDLRIPAMLIAGRETAAPIRPSSDVIIVDAPEKRARELPLAIDLRVRITLGEHVLVDTEGVDARLEGNLLLAMSGLDPEKITAQGEIHVEQGKYSTYGVSLDITRGNLLFAGGPVDQPILDIRAMRTVGEVRAGVKVSGTPRQPRVELISEPAMTDTDVLAYIVLGHPIGEEGGANAGLLMLAANTLLSKGESAVLQDRLKRTFGLDVLAIDAGDGDIEGSQITIGKYLNPDLYISFGQSLFSNTNELRVRYNLSRRWQIESSVGEQSAVDLFYKIEFR